MILEILIIICSAAILIFNFFWYRMRKWDSSIKGPKGSPIIGNVLQIGKLQHLTYAKWAEIYGPIYRVDLVTTRVFVISDPKWVRELFNNPAFSGRMDVHLFDLVDENRDGTTHGVMNSDGPLWEELRRFTIRNLKDFGFGKTSMENSIMIEVNELIEGLLQSLGKPLTNVKKRLLLAAVNSLWSIVTSKRYNQNDDALIKLTEQSTKTFSEVLENGGLLFFVPWVGKYFPGISGYTKIRKMLDAFSSNFKKPLVEHLETYEENNNTRDFIDAYIKQMKATEDPKSIFYGKTGEKNLQALLCDLYNAGTDTIAGFMSFMILYLSKLTHVQKKFQEEIDTITGHSRQCSLGDRAKMPYTEATIAEVLRFCSHVPLGGKHRAMKDQEFHGFMIPKDTVIISNLYAIHHDPKIWGDPESFRPDRFLSPVGKTFKKHEAFLPFSVGKRQCLGEALARDSLFLFATNIFQRFYFEFDTNGPDNGFEPKFGFILTPKDFHVHFKDRLA